MKFSLVFCVIRKFGVSAPLLLIRMMKGILHYLFLLSFFKFEMKQT
jgi:hypothetical protein